MGHKPIEVMADGNATYTLPMTLPEGTTTASYTYAKNANIGKGTYFKVGNDSALTIGTYSSTTVSGYAYYLNNDSKEIVFTVPTGKKATVTVEWAVTNAAGGVQMTGTLADGESTQYVAGKGNIKTKMKSIFNVKEGSHSLKRYSNTAYIYGLEVVEEDASTGGDSTDDSTTKYTVTVNDGTNTSTNDYEEGESVTIKTDKDNFAYWLNSNNKIVSIDSSYTFNIYYSDTYTAVYNDTTSKKVLFMTAYNQIYGTVDYNEKNFSDSDIPAVPTRYGYISNGWDKDVEAIKSALESSDYVEVNPNYKTDEQKTYRVKINSDAVGATYTVNGTEYASDTDQDFAVNTIISVTMVDPDKYNCWVNNSETSEVLSYNKTYTLFVNRDIAINVKSRDIEEKEGLITLINADTNSDGDKVFIYEFTVPDGYSIEFAGVLGDTTEANVNDKAAKYVGGRASSATTFRYTLTIDSSLADNLYIMPILKYSIKDSNGATTLKTVCGKVQKASEVK